MSRMAQFNIAKELLVEALRGGFSVLPGGRFRVVTSDLPVDLKILDVWHLNGHGQVTVIAESESFEKVPPAGQIPEVDMTCRSEVFTLEGLVRRYAPGRPDVSGWAWNREILPKIRELIPDAPILDEDLVQAIANLLNRNRENEASLASGNAVARNV
jgi:hypothetical protein